MSPSAKHLERLLDTVLIYLPCKQARQFLTDVYRSRAAEDDAALREISRRLVEALDRRHPENAPPTKEK